MAVNGSLVSPVTVESGGILSGTGSLSSVTVNAGGQLAPGNSLGVMTLSGSLTLTLGARMDYDLDGLLTDNEVYMPSGHLALTGQQFSDFNFTPLADFGAGTYTLIDAGSIGGSLGAGTSGVIDGLPANLAVQGNDLVLNVSAVPEPSTFILLVAGRRRTCRLRFLAEEARSARSFSGCRANSGRPSSQRRCSCHAFLFFTVFAFARSGCAGRPRQRQRPDRATIVGGTRSGVPAQRGGELAGPP